MKKRILIGSIVLVVIGTILICLTICGRIFNPLTSSLKLAVKYYNEGNYEEAVLQFDKAIAINDKLPEVYFAKASAEILLEKDDNAIQTILASIKLIMYDNLENNPATDCMKTLFIDSKYQGTDEILLWWYDKTYDNEAYSEYREWIENNYSNTYNYRIAEIQKSHMVDDSMYDDILVNYQKAENNNYEYDDINGEVFEEVYPNVNAEIALSGGKPKLYYLVKDLNRDGIIELVIASLNGSKYHIYDIYTYDNKPKQLFNPYSMGYRVIYSLYEDGYIGAQRTGGTGVFGGLRKTMEFSQIDMSKPGNNYIVTKEYFSEYANDTYYVSTNGKDYNNEITEDEYRRRVEKYKELENIEWKALKEYTSNGETIQEETVTNNNLDKILTEDEAIKLVIEKTKGEYKLALDSEDDIQFVFRQYEDDSAKQTTINWFYVNKKTCEVTSMF